MFSADAYSGTVCIIFNSQWFWLRFWSSCRELYQDYQALKILHIVLKSSVITKVTVVFLHTEMVNNWDVLTLTEVLVNKKRMNVYEDTVKMAPSLLCVHIHSLSSDWQRPLWVRKHLLIFNFLFYMCLLSADLFIFW